jgi:hypothetical protein
LIIGGGGRTVMSPTLPEAFLVALACRLVPPLAVGDEGQHQRAERPLTQDADLVGVCDPDTLRKLPESEQVAWRNLY